MLISLSAFVFALALFVSAHQQFRMLGAGAADGGGSSSSSGVDNGRADGAGGLQYGPCLWMQATSLVVVLFTPVVRTASRAWRDKQLQRAGLGPQSAWKVSPWS